MLNSACALRVFLRYLHREGILATDLVRSVPRGRVYRQASIPRAIRWEDGPALQELFTRTREIRRGVIEAGQETAEPDFGRPHGAHDAGEEHT